MPQNLKINDLHVDIKYSPIVEKALHEDNPFIAGLTFTDNGFVRAGKYFIHKEVKDNVAPGAPGRDFTSVEAEDSLVEIALDQNFIISKNVRGVALGQIEYDVVASQVDLATRAITLSMIKTLLAKMVVDATDLADTAAITSANVKEKLIAARKKLRDAGGRMDYIMASTHVYGAMLGDKANFAPTMNDEQLRSGVVGRYLGVPVIEANALNGLITPNGSTDEYDLDAVDFVIGQTDGFGIYKSLDALRVKDTEDFIGVKVQGELNVGGKVATSEKVVVKFNTTDFIVPEVVE